MSINNCVRDLDKTFPLVSIVIATYNRSSSLEKYSLPGIENLTYPNYEVIIVDDASTDNTYEFLQNYQAKKQKNFLLLRNRKNSGAAFSRNRGVANAKGEFIVLIDDDVSLFQDSLEKLIETYNKRQEIMAIWGCVWEYNNSTTTPTKSFGSGSFWSLRKEVFNAFRFDANMKYFNTPACDEHELARRLKRYGYKFMKLETAQANHFHAPADNRKRRGIGGDLNYLYENIKTGSVLEYYLTLIKSWLRAVEFVITRKKKTANINSKYNQLILTPEHIWSFLRDKRITIAIKWLYYTTIDIPFKAKTQVIRENIYRNYSHR